VRAQDAERYLKRRGHDVGRDGAEEPKGDARTGKAAALRPQWRGQQRH